MGMGHGFSAYVLAWHIQQMIFKYIYDHLQILVLLHMLCYAVLSHFSCIRLFAMLWTVACQAPLSIGILQARILEWIAMPSSRGIFPTQGSNPQLLHLLHWEAGSLPLTHLECPLIT